MNLNLKLNARFQPKHRFELEDALDEILSQEQRGKITGGGTAMTPQGEVAFCDIEIDLEQEADLPWLSGLLDHMGIPKGSLLQGAGEDIPVGTLEGMACYLNGTDLPEEVYQSCDINLVIQEMEKAMEGIGSLYSYWEGPDQTALYFYGRSFTAMQEKTAPFLASYPLCRGCRVEQIA